MKKLVLYLFSFVLLASCSKNDRWILMNSSGTLRYTLHLNKGELMYKIDLINSDKTIIPVIEESPLGISRADEDFHTEISFISVKEPITIDETYIMISGKQNKIPNRAIEQAFEFKNRNGAPFQIIVRGYDDGMAFRYAFPDTSDNIYSVIAESTGFKVPANGKAWMHAYTKVDTWAPAYESVWENKIDIGTPSPDSVGWAFPVLFNTNGLWTLITEAGMDTTCFGLHLQPHAENGLYKVRLPETDETYGVGSREASITLPWKSPWKVIVTGTTPAPIVETNIITNLSAPCELKDVSWVKPGRVSWSWWSDPSSPYNYEKLIPFIDLSSKLGWEYSLIDLGWHQMVNGGDIKKLINYAKSRNVGLILWYNSGGKHNQVPDACPCDIMDKKETRRAEMKRISDLGIKGIKIDFMQSDKQCIMKLYQDILRDAADFHLFVDFHGATIPRGWNRTYPNLLSMEGIRGAEQYWDTLMAENAHTYHTIYTFTRNVIGSMDYTPVLFSFPHGKVPHLTTNAHELATAVAFESGVQHFADDAGSYMAQPDFVLEFFRIVPVVWDETRYVDGIPGELSVIARRSGTNWFVSILNGEKETKTIEVHFDFLGEEEYNATIIKDGKDQTSFENMTTEINSNSVERINLASRGGSVIHLAKKH